MSSPPPPPTCCLFSTESISGYFGNSMSLSQNHCSRYRCKFFFSLSKTPPTLTLWLSSFMPLQSFWQASPFLSKGVFSWPGLPHRLDCTKGLLSRWWKKVSLTPPIPTPRRICAEGDYVHCLSGPWFLQNIQPDFPRGTHLPCRFRPESDLILKALAKSWIEMVQPIRTRKP